MACYDFTMLFAFYALMVTISSIFTLKIKKMFLKLRFLLKKYYFLII